MWLGRMWPGIVGWLLDVPPLQGHTQSSREETPPLARPPAPPWTSAQSEGGLQTPPSGLGARPAGGCGGPAGARRRCLRAGHNMQRNLQKFPETDSAGVTAPASQMGKEARGGENSPDGMAAWQQDPGPGSLAGACPPPDLWPSSRPKQHPIDDKSYNADPQASPALQPPPLVQSPGGQCHPLAWGSFATAACL